MLILTTSALQMRMDKEYKLLPFKGRWIKGRSHLRRRGFYRVENVIAVR